MRAVKKNWTKLASGAGFGCVALIALYACVSAWAQTNPVLTITASGTNQVILTVTNGTNTGKYAIYFAETIGTNPYWLLLTNGATGQTNFTNFYQTTQGFYSAVPTTSPSSGALSVTIISPANGTMIY